MNFIKIILPAVAALSLAACQSMPENVRNIGQSLNDGIKKIDTALGTPANSNNGPIPSSSKSKPGMLTSAQCQSSTGKTKSQVEAMAKEKLTDSRAYSLNSFAVTYNFELSDRASRYGVNDQSRAICSITLDGNAANSKVVNWTVIG